MDELQVSTPEWLHHLDCYTIHNIIEYFDIDTGLIMQRIDKQFTTEPIQDIKPKFLMKEGARCCSNKMIDYAVSKGVWKWEYALWGACLGGHLDMVNLAISKGTNFWNWGLEGACEGGHIDIARLMIANGADVFYHSFELACSNGYFDIVKLIIEKDVGFVDYGMAYACRGLLNIPHHHGHIEIIKLLISKGATNCYCGKSMQEHLEMT